MLAPNVRVRSLYKAWSSFVEGVLRSEFWLNDEYVDGLFMARYPDVTDPPTT